MSRDFLTEIKDAGKAPVTLYIRFLQEYKLTEKSLHLFIEGNDDPSFYTNCVRNIAGDNYKLYFYNSKNKSGVYENYRKINWSSYEKNRVLFFVDKDYSDILKLKYQEDDNIFVTKYYSIENYLVNEGIIRRILVDLLHITDPDIMTGVVNKFKVEHQSFCQNMVLITSWIIYHRQKGTNLPLNNISLANIFKFQSDLTIVKINRPQGKRLLKFLEEKTGVADTEECWRTVKEIYKNLCEINENKIHLRGKFEIWFLVAFINALILNLNSSRVKGEPKTKMNVNLSNSNAVALLGSRMSIPKDLRDFLITNLGKN